MFNPFRPLPTNRRAIAAPLPRTGQASVTGKTLRTPLGLSGQERAQAMNAMSHDLTLHAARIHYLKTLGQRIYEGIKDEEQIGPSRLAWLQKMLDQKDL